jgi:diguanylate cyclase (GGDEF)-like protein
MDQFQGFKLRVLRHLALLGAVVTFSLVFYYYFWADNRRISLACLVCAAIDLGIFADSHVRPQHSTMHSRLLMATTVMLMWIGIYLDEPEVVNDPWLIMFPAIAFSLVNPTSAAICTVAGLIGMFVVRQVQPHPVPLASALIIAFAYTTTSIIIAIFAFQNRENVQLIRKLGDTDSLTGVLNRRTLNETLEAEFRRNLRQAMSMTVFMVDVDYFKPYNDRYGHVRGDSVLVTIADALKQTARRSGDFVFRYGGEEFCILCSGLDVAQAATFAEQLRANVEALALEHEDSAVGRISVSVGYRHADTLMPLTPNSFVEEADQALYLAKTNGRNRVERHSDTTAM